MRLFYLKGCCIGIGGLLLLLCGISVAAASVEVSHAWLRAPIPGQNMTAAYFQLYNPGAKVRVLQAVEANFAERAEMHTQLHSDAMVQMRPLASVVLAPQQRINFASGGHHIMLFNLDRSFIEIAEKVAGKVREKQLLTLTLIFADGQRLPVVLPLRSLQGAVAEEDVSPSIHHH